MSKRLDAAEATLVTWADGRAQAGTLANEARERVKKVVEGGKDSYARRQDVRRKKEPNKT